MASRGDVQRQLSQLMGVINAQGYKFEDVMPDEMQDHFQDMTALKEARAYIQEIEAREKDLQATNTDLLAQLQAKQTEIDNVPDEFKDLQVQVQQAQHRIDFFKTLAERETERAAQYQSKFEKACRQQTEAAVDARKIRQLEQSLADREAVVFKLLQENENISEVYEAKCDEALQLSEDRDVTIASLRTRANQLEAEAAEERDMADVLTETCNSLVDVVGRENSTAAEVINAKSVQLFKEREANDQFYSAIISELVPLNNFYQHAFNILEVYRSTLENPLATKPLPQSLNSMLDSANDQLDFYKHLATDLRFAAQAAPADPLRDNFLGQVDTMATLAANMYVSLDKFKQNMSDHLTQLRTDTGSACAFDARTNERLRAFSSPTHSRSSSRSSVVSFTSIVKRFSSNPA